MHIDTAYKVLGLNSNSSDDDVKKASKKLMAKYHPDVNKDSTAEQNFKNVNTAVQTIEEFKKNPTSGFVDDPLWNVINRSRSARPNQQYWNQSAQPSNPAEFFDEIFGGGQANPFRRSPEYTHFDVRPKSPPANPDIEFTIELSFKEAILGCNRNITYERHEACKKCSATGTIKSNNKCPLCQGKGSIIKNMTLGNATIRQQTTCGMCFGTGRVLESCKKCNTTGFIKKRISKSIEIPPGVATGNKAIDYNGGNEVMVDRAGSLIILLKVLEDKKFVRVNNDIHLIHHVSLLDALRGRSTKVTNITGTEYDVSIPKEIKNADVVRVSSEGVPKTEGSFCLRVMVDYPSKSESVEELIKILEESGKKNE